MLFSQSYFLIEMEVMIIISQENLVVVRLIIQILYLVSYDAINLISRILILDIVVSVVDSIIMAHAHT